MNQQILEDREVYTFCAGPCILPKSVLKQTQDEFMNYKGTGLSICEINHRGKEYAELNQNVMDGIKKLLNVPDNYKIMLTQGGSTSLNSAIPFNIAQQDDSANYIVTGLWGKNSQAESTKFVNSHLVTEIPNTFVRIPKTEEWNVKADAKYFYYTDNETVDGLEFTSLPQVEMPLVCDMTSSMGTKTLDVSKYGVIFGSVQKNLGPSGCCICIVRDDLVGIQRKNTPQMFSWQDNLAFKSIVNTPPVINTYMTGLVIDFLNQTGGASVYEQQSIVRQKLVYDVIDSSHGFYTPRVKQDDGRSRLNIVFYLKDEQLTQQFITEAGKIGLIELKGHASTGGIRVSMYNGMPLSGVQKLRDFMLQFQQKHQQ